MKSPAAFSLPFALAMLLFSADAPAGNDAGLGFPANASPPGIAGKWTGPGWGMVKLRQVAPGKLKGTYTDTFGGPGTLELAWDAGEGRFYGSWREGKDTRIGELSVRFDAESGTARGAWTANKDSRINPGVPRLADLEWKPVAKKD